jgi:uncharacterized protein YxjI
MIHRRVRIQSILALLILTAAFHCPVFALEGSQANVAKADQSTVAFLADLSANSSGDYRVAAFESHREGESPALSQRRRRGGANRYQMRQKMVSIGDDFWIVNEKGDRVFKVDGKALRVRETLVFEDARGKALCEIQAKVLTIKDSMEIERPGGGRMALVQKALITPLRERFVAKIPGGEDLEIQGNLLDHEYDIKEGKAKVAEVSKKWFRLTDS